MLGVLALLLVTAFYVLRVGFVAKGRPLAVLGSGGHTGEMLTMLTMLDLPKGIDFVYGAGDALSVEKARLAGFEEGEFVALPRARRVGQPLWSSVFTSLRTAYAAQNCLRMLRPQLLLCNGPGTCLIVVLMARVLCLRTRVIYVESLARVTSLSLTGKLVYHLRLADRFLVQWPELVKLYPGTEYNGCLT